MVRKSWPIVLLLTGLLVSLDASARRDFEREPGRFAPQRQQRGGLDEAVAGVRERTGGRVLSAQTRERDGRRYHYIRVLMPDGEVRRIRVNADNGRRRR